MLYAACFLRLLLAPYRAFLTRNRCLGETMLFCARRAPGLRPRRPRPACGRAGIRRRRVPFARSLCAQNKPCRAAAFFAAAGPRLRLRALCRPCGRPKPPFSGALAAAATVPALFLNSRFFSVRGNYFGIIVEFILTVVCVQTVYLLLYIIKLSVAEAHDIRRLQQRGNKSFVAGKEFLLCFGCIAVAG